MLIASTATIGLVLVGVLVLSMTPDRLGAPDESIIDSTDIVVAPNPASGNGSTTNGEAESVADNVLRAVSTLLNAPTTPPLIDVDPANPIDPTGAATTPTTSLPNQAATSSPPFALLPVDSSQTAESLSATPSTTAVAAPGTEPVVSSVESAFTTQVEPTADDRSQAEGAAPPGPSESTESLGLVDPASSTSSTASTVPGQSTTSTSTTTSTTTTAVSTTSTTLASQVKQLG